MVHPYNGPPIIIIWSTFIISMEIIKPVACIIVFEISLKGKLECKLYITNDVTTSV